MDPAPHPADLRLGGPVALAWVIAALLVGRPGAAWWTVGTTGTVGVVVLTLLVLWTGSGVLALPPVLALLATTAACCTLVGVAVGVGYPERSPAVLAEAAGRTTEVEVVLTRDLGDADRSTTGTLRRLGGTGGLDVPVRIVPAVPTRAPAGAVLTGRASVESDDGGGPEAAVVFLRGASAVDPPTGVLAATDRVRQAFVRVTDGLPEPGGALLRGLAIGDRSGLDPGTESAMETAALTHLTAVSGSNCAVVVALVVAVGRGVGLPRPFRAALAGGFLVAFVALVRPDPSIVRAAVMAVVVLGVRLSGRPVRGVPLLALAVLGMLVVDPWYARSVAFALSVLATAGIVVLAPPLTALLSRRLWTPFAAALSVPVAAQVACWPVTVVLSPTLPTFAVPANLLTEPLAPVVTVTGLLTCLLAPVWPWGAAVTAHVAWVPAACIGVVATTTAGLPAAELDWPVGVTGTATAGLVSLAVAAAVLARGRTRARLLVAAASVVVLGVGVVAVPQLVVRGTVPGDWSVVACDVGQGDAVLVRDGRGPVALVDTGDDGPALRRCLDLLGVERVDLLVLTHFDRDHVGAVGAVADRTDRALVGPVGRPEDDRVLRVLEDAGVDLRTGDDGTAGTLGRLRWRLVWPPAGAAASGNDASLVLETAAGPGCEHCVSGVFLGDLGERAQRRLRPLVETRPDVVKVAHHGSSDQDPVLYRQLAAPVGLIGVGADNTYGHPTRTALDALRAAGTIAFRTDHQGTIVVSRDDGGALRVWTERAADDGPPADPTAAPPAVGPAAERPRWPVGSTQARTRSTRRRRKERMPAKKPARAAAKIDQVPWSGVRPAPVVLVTGPEQFLAERASSVLRDLLVGEDPALEVHDLEADQYAPGLLATLASPSLFGEPRLVRVINVEKCTDAFITETISYLQAPADDVTLVLRHGGGVRGKKLLDTIRSGVGGGVEVQCDELKRDTDKADFVNAEFRAARRRIAPSAVRTLVAAFADDLAELAAACRQLLADEAEEITDRVVDKYYGGRVETNAFKVADIALAGRSAPAIVELRHALATGEAPVPIVAAFASKIRTMAKVSAFRGPSGQAASALGMAPWQVQRAQRDVAGWSEAGLANAITSIAAADTAVKGGSRDAHYALEVMVRTIARRGEDR